MKPVTIAEAARLTRTSKSTIQRAINKHELSASRDDQERWTIDPAELSRVFEVHHDELMVQPGAPENTDAPVHQATPTTIHEADQLHHEKQLLELKAETAQELANQYKDQVDDLRHRLDSSESERRKATAQITALLTHQAESTTASEAHQPKSLWRFFS